MKLSLIFATALASILAVPAWAQAQPSVPVNGTTGYPLPSPFQALANIIRNPTEPPPVPPTPVSGAPLPTAIPPNTIGLPQPAPAPRG